MASLADELLADVDEGAGAVQPDDRHGTADAAAPAEEALATGGSAAEAPATDGDAPPPVEMDQADVEAIDLGVDSAASVTHLLGSDALRELLASIDHYMAQPPPPVAGAVESSPEYALIVRANNTAVEVDNEIMILHRFIRERYAPRFPELETLVLNPWEFIQAVRTMGNERDLAHTSLEGILPHGTVVVISMTAATTPGRPLPDAEWRRVQEACDMVHELDAIRHKILGYVESRMTLLAPNLSALVTTRVGTKLVGAAGGLASLAKIPACNLHLLGASRRQPSGLSSAHGASSRFSGFLAQCDLVSETPEEYRTQALRMVAAKVSLAARMDSSGGSARRDGAYGAKLHEEIEQKLDKLQEPPPAKLVKALPVPHEGGRKQRRGGRRARKFREMNGLTELRKMQNRLEFGKAEEESGAFDETMGLGMINSKASGKIRATGADARSKAKMSKANKARIETLNRAPSLSATPGTSTSGTASSLSFTPVQGIELVDPSRQNKVEEANAKWFSESQFSLVPGVGSSKQQSIPGSMGPPPPPPRQQ